MIAPTKGIAPHWSLLVVGAQILQILDQPMTVSQAWTRLQRWRTANGCPVPVPFWWFVLSLDVLYALGVVELERELLTKRRADVAPTQGR